MAKTASMGYQTRQHTNGWHNMATPDRALSAALGVASLRRRKARHGLGKLLAVAGGVILLRRAATGHSGLYDVLGVSSARLGEGAGLNLEAAVTIMRPREELYEFWRNPENLPLVMSHVEFVESRPDGTSHWTVAGPRNTKLEWDSAIMNESPGEYLAWHSVEGSKIEHSGSVHFNDAGEHGTEVVVRMRYVPPGLAAGFAVAKILNPITEAQLAEDLRRFKHVMETGSDITVEGQPQGPKGGE